VTGATVATGWRSALCEGTVSHRRVEGPGHGFRYRVLMTLLDLDELAALDRSLRLFGHDRARVLSFHERDHLAASGRGVRAELESLVRAEGLEMPGGRVELLTSCRVLGYVFNPVSFFYCYDPSGRLALVEGGYEWRRKKLMHVSPFTRPDAGTYAFALPPPGPRVEASIDLTRGGSTVVATRLSLEGRPLDDRAILSAFVRYPFQTLKVIGAIHYEALRLWSKGAPFWPRPPYDPAAARGGPA
jgi:DUF1365 family protein